MDSNPVGDNSILRSIDRRVGVCMEGMGVARGEVRTRQPCIVLGTLDTALAIDTVVAVDLLKRYRLWACHF